MLNTSATTSFSGEFRLGWFSQCSSRESRVLWQNGISGWEKNKRLENVWQVWFKSLVGKLVLWKKFRKDFQRITLNTYHICLYWNEYLYIHYTCIYIFRFIYIYICVFLLIHVYQHNTCLSSDNTPIGLICLCVAYVSCQVMTMSHDGLSPQRWCNFTRLVTWHFNDLEVSDISSSSPIHT